MMKFFSLTVLFFIAILVRVQAQDHVEEVDPVVSTHHVSLLSFYRDTLHNASFFRSNYAVHTLPMAQLEPGPELLLMRQAPISLKHANRDHWLFLLVIGIALLLLIIKFTFSKLFQNAIFSFYKRSAISDIINDHYSPRWLFAFFSNLFFVLVISLWAAYQNFTVPGAPVYETRLDIFLEIFLILLGIYAIKFLVHLMAGALIDATDAVLAYLLNVSITHLVCGILMFFITLLFLYSPWRGPVLFNISLIMLGVFIVIRYLKNFVQTIQFFKYNYLYLILYLCTLEITPWFLLIKYLNNHL